MGVVLDVDVDVDVDVGVCVDVDVDVDVDVGVVSVLNVRTHVQANRGDATDGTQTYKGNMSVHATRACSHLHRARMSSRLSHVHVLPVTRLHVCGIRIPRA